MYLIRLAGETDLDGLASLLQANAPSRGGSLTGEFPREKVQRMAFGEDSVVVIARKGEEVVGALFSSSKDDPTAPPIIQAMLAAWPGSANAYVYGPACVAESERGQGLLANLYRELQLNRPGEEAICFIREDNIASIRAHERLGMQQVAEFRLEGVQYLVFHDCPASTASPRDAENRR